MAIRILIADDHGVLRAGLRALLNGIENLTVVGEAASGEEAVRLATTLAPDVILLDIVMSGLSGIEITRHLKQAAPKSRVLILTLHEDLGLMREAIRAGASGYVTKRAVDFELMNAIFTVWRGEIYVHPTMTRGLLKDVLPCDDEQGQAATLTPREMEVMRLIVEGHSNRQIGELLNLSIRTVDTHRANVMAKLGLHDRADLCRYAVQHQLFA